MEILIISLENKYLKNKFEENRLRESGNFQLIAKRDAKYHQINRSDNVFRRIGIITQHLPRIMNTLTDAYAEGNKLKWTSIEPKWLKFQHWHVLNLYC